MVFVVDVCLFVFLFFSFLNLDQLRDHYIVQAQSNQNVSIAIGFADLPTFGSNILRGTNAVNEMTTIEIVVGK